MKRPNYSGVRKALVEAFPDASALEVLVDDAVGEGTWRDQTDGVEGFPKRVKRVITYVAAQGYLTRLLRDAAEENAYRAEGLHALAREFAEPLNRALEELSDEPRKLEAIFNGRVPIEDAGDWIDQLLRRRRAICRVEPQPYDSDDPSSRNGYGTGFLVAEGVVMTAGHVVKAIKRSIDVGGRGRVTLRFDFWGPESGGQPVGVQYGLSEDWHIDGGAVSSLDVGFVRVEPRVEDEYERIPVKIAARDPRKGDPIFILQHPDALPMKLAFGEVRKIEEDEVAYEVPTMNGASGAPVMGMNLQAGAIHFSEFEGTNRAVPMGIVRRELESVLQADEGLRAAFSGSRDSIRSKIASKVGAPRSPAPATSTPGTATTSPVHKNGWRIRKVVALALAIVLLFLGIAFVGFKWMPKPDIRSPRQMLLDVTYMLEHRDRFSSGVENLVEVLNRPSVQELWRPNFPIDGELTVDAAEATFKSIVGHCYGFEQMKRPLDRCVPRTD